MILGTILQISKWQPFLSQQDGFIILFFCAIFISSLLVIDFLHSHHHTLPLCHSDHSHLFSVGLDWIVRYEISSHTASFQTHPWQQTKLKSTACVFLYLKATICGQNWHSMCVGSQMLQNISLWIWFMSICFLFSILAVKWFTRLASQIRTRLSNILCELRK